MPPRSSTPAARRGTGSLRSIGTAVACLLVVAGGGGIMALAFRSQQGISDPASGPSTVARAVPVSDRLRVTLDYRPGPGAAATLVRFPRNGHALVRRGDGGLALDAAGRSPLRLGAKPPAQAVRVTLDLGSARVTARAGAQTISISHALRRERKIVLDPATARTGNVRVSTGAPSPRPADTARFFAPGSVWRAPVARDAPLDPDGPALVKTLDDTVASNLSSGRGPWIATTESSTPLYRVRADQPTVRVQLHTGPWGAGLQRALNAVPIPPNARPANGPDRHMAIWQPATDRFFELFHARKLADGWHADYGGAIERVSQSPGYYTKDSWPGLSNTQWGASASSLPVSAGLILVHELRAGRIDHALNLAIPTAKAHAFTLPAQRTDGIDTAPDAIPEGAHFRLDPSLDLSKLDLPPATRTIAEAAQRYGLIVTDQTGWAVGLFAEDPTTTGSDPYTGPNGLFDGRTPKELLAKFPWRHLQLLRMEMRRG
jgi:hypothetical protein